ncbi:MAG: YidC/Oxa1 family membrane protein insertase [Dethiobacteria bacterium]|jgi:YidC/Oxa1 family membrane protein insertase|nr:membrane protein insertase YidC [Bacillota bacterium]
MSGSIIDFFGVLLKFFYVNLVPNYGVSIIILTVLVKIITYPLNKKQMQSAKKMQEIQPELKKIQQKYKNDKEKLNKATMEFMQKNNVNPLAGCLPLLVQFPILISIFNLLRENPSRLEMVPGFTPYLFPNLELISLLEPDPYYILPVLAGLTTFWQQKLMITDPNQKTMLYVMPAMLLILSINFPSGLVLYWIMNNILTVGQHLLVNRPSVEKAVKEQ